MSLLSKKQKDNKEKAMFIVRIIRQYKKRNAYLNKVIADMREGIEQRDQTIKDLENALAELRLSRARLAECFLAYKNNSIKVTKIAPDVYGRRY